LYKYGIVLSSVSVIVGQIQRQCQCRILLGGTMTGYVTAGPYDVVEIIDVPNDDGALAFMLGSLSVKEIRTVTLQAFHEDQVRKTVQQMS
jgi:uncharacterized protein with GYD domain